MVFTVRRCLVINQMSKAAASRLPVEYNQLELRPLNSDVKGCDRRPFLPFQCKVECVSLWSGSGHRFRRRPSNFEEATSARSIGIRRQSVGSAAVAVTLIHILVTRWAIFFFFVQQRADRYAPFDDENMCPTWPCYFCPKSQKRLTVHLFWRR